MSIGEPVPAQGSLGSRITATRERRGLLQRELAHLAQISVGFLSEIENDRRAPGSEILLRIADALGASLDYLLRGATVSEPAPITIPPPLQEAAEAHGWSYTMTADLLRAQSGVVGRRTPEGSGQRPPREWTTDDWVRLKESLFPDG